MSVKSSLGLVLYCYLNMPTINKTYLILSYLTLLVCTRTKIHNLQLREQNDDVCKILVTYQLKQRIPNRTSNTFDLISCLKQMKHEIDVFPSLGLKLDISISKLTLFSLAISWRIVFAFFNLPVAISHLGDSFMML